MHARGNVRLMGHVNRTPIAPASIAPVTSNEPSRPLQLDGSVPSGVSGRFRLGFHGLPLTLALLVADEHAEQLVEIRLGRFHEHASVAAHRHRPVASGVHPTLLGRPIHLA